MATGKVFRPLYAVLFILAAAKVQELRNFFSNTANDYSNIGDIFLPEKIHKENAIPRYYELEQEIRKRTNDISHNSETAYNRARVVEEAPWFAPREICKKSCCAKRVAISLDQDETQIINTMDGLDLAEVVVRNNPGPRHLQFHANVFHEEMIPCLQPGTTIHLNNRLKMLEYFWRQIRPNITVPFLLITSDSDADSPIEWAERLEDPLLLKWYGMNPRHSEDSRFQQHVEKFEPMSLGLSMNHPQAKYLFKYLELSNFSNPFLDKRRWTSREISWKDDVLVNFSRRKRHRRKLWENLCPDSNATNGVSCSSDRVDPSDIYASSSRFRFGISPPGAGWDCYRTYELLLLGVIPVIEERNPEGHQLFEGLPVVHMPNMREAKTKQEFQTAIQNYLESDAFQKSIFDGWQRLFLRYWRRKILHDAGRDILQNEQGREYYLAWRYTSKSEEEVYCSRPGKCK